MFCLQCGNTIPVGSRFCQQCGQSQPVVPASSGATAAVEAAPIPVAKPRPKIVLWILLTIFAVIVFWAVGQINEHGYYGADAHSQQQAYSHPQPQFHTQATGAIVFTVAAGGTYEHKITVPAGAYNVKLKGHFSATGGSGNDIEVFVLTQDNYVNWNNGHSVPAFYKSGKVTQNAIDVSLPFDAGTYYILFSNKFSFMSPKAIQANMTLTYYTQPAGLGLGQ
jgi:hypothetical protein